MYFLYGATNPGSYFVPLIFLGTGEESTLNPGIYSVHYRYFKHCVKQFRYLWFFNCGLKCKNFLSPFKLFIWFYLTVFLAENRP